MLSQIPLILQAQGFDVSEITPDKKVHRFPMGSDDTEILGFYVAFQMFTTATGEPFYVVVYGNLEEEKHLEHCTLDNPGFNDKLTIKSTIKLAARIIKKFKEDPAPVKKQVDSSEFIRYLGFSESTYFFTSSHNKQIVGISRFTRDSFLNLMPLSYWETLYPGGGATRVSWDEAASDITVKCRARGIFQSRNVRGSGVWRDKSRVVINMGDHLIVNGNRHDLGDIDSQYFYTMGVNLSELHPNPLTAVECSILTDACETFKWQRPEFGILLAGSLVTARVCGALPVRPHLWITGGAGEGKSTLLDKLIKPVLGKNMLYVQGSTTEAGIRQSLKANAVPLLFDEFESNSQKSLESVQAVLDLVRAAWSDSEAQIVKGSSGGTANAFRVSFSAIVSSIRVKLMNDADVSRFAQIELKAHGNDPEHWARLSLLLDQLTPEYCERFFARVIHMLPIMLQNYRILKSALSKKASSRFGDQYGMLLAAYSILAQDEVITPEQVQVTIDHIQLKDERETSKVTDHDECFNHLLTKTIEIESEEGEGERARINRYKMTVGDAIRKAMGSSGFFEEQSLNSIGIKVDSSQKLILVSTSHHELEAKVYRGSNWSRTWAKSLLRLPGASKLNDTIWIGGSSNRAISIPLPV